MKFFDHLYPKIISIENLIIAWEEFAEGKKQKTDVRIFAQHLLQNILSLHDDLLNYSYKHGDYQRFTINDPKERVIHKATVRDRLLHHAIHRVLYPIFDQGFIFDSYSCRLGKGTHRAVNRLGSFVRKVSKNYTKPCFVLKCDIKKYFGSVDRKILISIIEQKISDANVLRLLKNVLDSFQKTSTNCGIPLGNLTSQLFANIYLNEFDRFIKHQLKIKYYARYCDDFIILGNNPKELEKLVPIIERFLNIDLKLKLHKQKTIIRKLGQGIDFLGCVILPYHRVLRTKTKKRMLGRANKKNLPSYLGVLKHCDGYKLRQAIANKVNFT